MVRRSMVSYFSSIQIVSLIFAFKRGIFEMNQIFKKYLIKSLTANLVHTAECLFIHILIGIFHQSRSIHPIDSKIRGMKGGDVCQGLSTLCHTRFNGRLCD